MILDVSCGRYYSLGGRGAGVWSALTQGYSPAAVATALTEPGWPDALSGFIDRLVQLELLRDSGQAGTDALPGADAEALARHEGAPQIDMFDDLADLIVADPIHDVEPQAGWPHRPAEA